MREALFELGEINITFGAQQAATMTGENLLTYLTRHNVGDWGDMPLEDRALNEKALKYGGRLRSAYQLIDGAEIWIITEADGSATNIMLPREY